MAVAQRKSGKPKSIVEIPGVTRPMTYEEYLSSPEEMARYDILDGWKVYRLYGEQRLTNPTIRHQKIERIIARAFEDYESSVGGVLSVVSPCDVLVRLRPAKIRQPDVLMISNHRLGDKSIDDPEPLSPAPELVVEIVSKWERPKAVQEKVSDYAAAGVLELWIVRSNDRTIEVTTVLDGVSSDIRLFKENDILESSVFPNLKLEVSKVFDV
jgi:Uma2 family endonuclease